MVLEDLRDRVEETVEPDPSVAASLAALTGAVDVIPAEAPQIELPR